MASLTRSQLKTSSNNTYDTNGIGGITAAEARTFNNDLIDSLITNDLTSSMVVLSASFASNAGTVGGQTLTSLNQFTASQDTKNTTLASYTGSNDITNTAQNNRLTNLESKSASVDISITNINQFTASNGNTSLNQFTSSADNRLNNLETNSASLNISISNLNSTTASQGISISNLNAATSSYAISSSVAAVDAAQQSQINSLIAASGSYLTSSTSLQSLNSFTQSQYVSNSFFATTGSNTFIGNQRISGSLSVTSSTEIGFVVRGGVITNPYLKIGTTNGNDISLEANDLNILLAGGMKINTTLAGNGIGIEGPDPTIALRDTTSPLNPYIALTNKNARLEIVDTNGTIVTMNTASFNIPSASFTASIQQGYAWVGNANGVSVAVATSSFAGGASTDITALNAFTASQDTKNSTLATYTGSNDTKWSNLGSQTGSFVTETESGSFLITASVNLNTITFTKGDNTTFAVTINTGSATSTDITSLNSFTASQDSKNSTLAIYTASVDTKFSNIGSQSASWDNTNLNSFTASQDTKNSTIATYTGSNDTKWSNLGSQSGSFVTESETGSFARTNVDNNFTVNQTFTNITAVSASFQYIQTTYETASVIYSSGSNQFGDELTDIQTLSGSVKVQGSLTVNGTPVQTSSVDITSLNAFTASQETKNSTLATYTASVNNSLTNINSFTSSNGNTSLNSYTASNDTKWTNLAGQTGSYVTSAITASSLVTASVNLNTITFTKGDASTFNITVNTGSAVTTDLTSLNAFTASQDTKNSTLASVTSSLNSATASLFTSASLALVTASFSGNTLTFTKGDASTFGVVIPDVSGSGTTNTGSLLVTASAFINTITFTKGDGTTFPVTVTTGSLNYVTGSFGAFYDTTTQSGSAGVAYSMKLNNTDISDGVIISGSGGIKVLAAGTYDLQFSAQVLADTGADTLWIWLKKNGTNVPDTSTKLVLRNNEADVAAWNFVVSANANDVFELAWQSNGGHTKLFAEAAASNYTAIPSVIATMNRVDVGGGTNLVSTASFNTYTSSTNTRLTNIESTTASLNTSVAALNTFTQSQDTKNSTLATYTASIDEKFATIGGQSGSWSGGATYTGSLMVTGSVAGNVLTFTKGDATTFNLTVDTGSGGGASIDTGSFATTGSNSFVGNQIITGSITSTLNGSFNGLIVGIGSGSNVGNMGIGSGSLLANIGTSTIGIGSNTLRLNKAANNIAIGNFALGLQQFTGTSNNIAIGISALSNLGSGSAGSAATMGANTVIGGGTGTALVTGTRNTIIGSSAFAAAISSDRNTGIGRGVLAAIGANTGTGSLYNTAIGHNALFQLISGSNNIVMHGGSVAGEGFITGSRNIVLGQDSGLPSSMESNTIIGRGITGLTSPLANNVILADGAGNIALQKNGATAAIQIANGLTITGSLLVNGNSSFIGNQRITGSLTMSGSILFVDRSGYDQNVYLGLNALGMGDAGAQPLALGNSISVAIGIGAMRFASGSNQNVAIGNNALLITTGSKNFAMGSEALSSNTTGQANVGIGTSALTKNTTGESNTAIGDSAGFNVSGSNNTFIGANSGYNISGSNNTILGRYQGSAGELLTNNIILADGEGQIKAQYSGSAWSFQGGIKLNVGGDKPANTVTLSTDSGGETTLSNSLIQSNSIILLTARGDYRLWVAAQTAGSATIDSSVGSTSITFNYLIINPTT
jgi:uncharacterized coiled-coil protein SlyX